MDIYEIYDIFNEIQSASAKTEKERILKEHKDNKDFRYALEFLLNTYIVTGISEKKVNKKIPAKTRAKIIDNVKELSSLREVIDYLKVNNSGKDVDIMAIQSFAITNSTDGNITEFIKKFATKTLKLGISEKTVNKVYGKGTIPSFAVMLAESYAKKSDKVDGRFYLTLKLDGNRCIAIVDDNSVSFFSRKGQGIEGLIDLWNQFKTLPHGVYDGELLLVNKDNLPSSELFRATQKVIRKDGEKKDLEFHIFDVLSLSEFQNGESNKPYSMRRNTLDIVIASFTENTENIHVLPVLYDGSDKSVIPTYAMSVESMGYEGIMINTADGMYRTKRVTDLLKVKSFKSADLLCLGVEEGTGRNAGRLGAILVEYKGGVTKVGTGFTDEERDYFWNNVDEISGKIIETKFFEESMDEKTEQVSMRFPVFVCVRNDKDIDDVRYE